MTTQSEKKIFVLADRKGDLSKRWYIHYKENGKRVKIYGGINFGKTTEERRTIALKLIRGLRKKYAQLPKCIDHKELLYNALEFERPQLRLKSYQTYKSKLDHLFSWLANDELSTENLRRYFILYRKHHNQMGTYNCRRMLMTFFKKTNLEHLLAPIKIKKGKHQPLRYFQPHQCREILNFLQKNDPELHLHCLFIYFTALRPRAELRQVKVGDIFWGDSKIAIRGEHTKNWQSEYIGIPDRFLPFIVHLKNRPPSEYIFPSKRDKMKPIGRNTLGERFREILNEMGYGSDYQLYSWKHTGAVAVYKATKNIYALKKHLRHKEIQTTELYIRQLGLSDFGDFYTNFPAPTDWH